MFVGRGVTIVLSLAGLVLYPKILGPDAHGAFQYYLSLNLLLLGLLNGSAAPMAAHYVALYRVSDPPRQGVFLIQTFRWYLLLIGLLWLVRPLLRDPTGFEWICVAVAISGFSQLVSAAIYGLGVLGPITWFPVLTLFVRIMLICGVGWVVFQASGPEAMKVWGIAWIPLLLLLSTLPSVAWMVSAFFRWKHEWFTGATAKTIPAKPALFPWKEIGQFGIAAVLGQLIYQTFTRTLTVFAKQWDYPLDEIGYLGLATQAFGQIVFLSGIFSTSVYPWLVSAGKEGNHDRFQRLQSESWRLCAVTAGWLVALVCILIRPLVWLFLGEEYHSDIDTIVTLVRIAAVAGAFMVVGEFHLRMLISLTQMRSYLFSLVVGFSLAFPYLLWVLAGHKSIAFLAWTLPLGVACMSGISVYMAPRTSGFWRTSSLTIAGCLLAMSAAVPFSSNTYTCLFVQGTVITLVYTSWAWVTGLVGREDLARLAQTRKPSPDEVIPE